MRRNAPRRHVETCRRSGDSGVPVSPMNTAAVQRIIIIIPLLYYVAQTVSRYTRAKTQHDYYNISGIITTVVTVAILKTFVMFNHGILYYYDGVWRTARAQYARIFAPMPALFFFSTHLFLFNYLKLRTPDGF